MVAENFLYLKLTKSNLMQIGKNILTLLFSLITVISFGQSTTEPQVAWRSATWADLPNSHIHPEQEDSGEDWWYRHTEIRDAAGEVVGYLGCGYSTWVNQHEGSDESAIGGCYESKVRPYLEDLNPPDPWSTSAHTRMTLLSPSTTFYSPRQTIGRYDLEGNMIWCKQYNAGTLWNIHQTSDGNFVAVGHSGSTRKSDGTPLYYNPGRNASAPLVAFNDGTSCTNGDNQTHLSLIKIDGNGDEIWNNLYGYEDYVSPSGSGAYQSHSKGLDFVELDYGYKVVGRANPLSETTSHWFARC